LTALPADEVIRRWAEFDTIIDARTEAEFAEDHLPGALNWPTLNNEQRIQVGTTYKQVNAFEAKKMGAAMAARNISSHIERDVMDKPKDWKPLTYCWRGGKRSGSLSLVLDQIGFKVTLVDGGYKAFRAALVLDIPRLAAQFNWQVVCGTTGSGKTRLLQAVAAAGGQVLDLEALANHRSSVLGAIPGLAQPTQKRFDTLIWDQLRRFDAAQPVFVESESKKVGNVAVPTALIDAMRAGTCLNLVLPDAQRVKLLMEDYDFFVKDPAFFCTRLEALREIRGHAVIDAWQADVKNGNIEAVVQALLTEHYDPVYIQSMRRNFQGFDSAVELLPDSRSGDAFAAVARSLVEAAASRSASEPEQATALNQG
jgi:tRNA 2-selenouridine synthase